LDLDGPFSVPLSERSIYIYLVGATLAAVWAKFGVGVCVCVHIRISSSGFPRSVKLEVPCSVVGRGGGKARGQGARDPWILDRATGKRKEGGIKVRLHVPGTAQHSILTDQ